MLFLIFVRRSDLGMVSHRTISLVYVRSCKQTFLSTKQLPKYRKSAVTTNSFPQLVNWLTVSLRTKTKLKIEIDYFVLLVDEN